MFGVVPPTIAGAASSPNVGVPSVDVRVPIKVVLVVDGDVAATPVAIAPVPAGPRTERKSGRAPRQPHTGVVSWIGIRIIGVGRRSRSVNNHRVVRGNVNHVRASWLNDNHLLAAFDCLGFHSLLSAGF
jgi:hypothetical protein